MSVVYVIGVVVGRVVLVPVVPSSLAIDEYDVDALPCLCLVDARTERRRSRVLRRLRPHSASSTARRPHPATTRCARICAIGTGTAHGSRRWFADRGGSDVSWPPRLR